MPVDLDDLRPGMVVAKSVYNSHGTLMFNEETMLSEKNIWILKSWGVKEVWIEGEGEGQINEGDNPKREKDGFFGKEVPGQVSKAIEDQVIVEIMRVANKQMQKRIYQDKQEP